MHDAWRAHVAFAGPARSHAFHHRSRKRCAPLTASAIAAPCTAIAERERHEVELRAWSGTVSPGASLALAVYMRTRSLWPREHGAYFQLAVPLVAALVRHPSRAGSALAAAATFGFLAHEPLLVMLGHRGPRFLAARGRSARTRFVALLSGAVILGALGLVVAPSALAVAGCAALITVVALAIGSRGEIHTIGGELVATVALTGACGPVLVAGGVSTNAALATWLVWIAGFGATVVAVHRVLARHKQRPAVVDRILAVAFTSATTLAAIMEPVAAPLVGVAAMLVIHPPRASRLRAVGLVIVAAALAGAALG